MYVVKRGIGVNTFALGGGRRGGVVLSISVLGPVLWEDKSTGRCTDAGAGNLLDKSNEQSTGHKRQGLDLKEMKLRLVVASERCHCR